MAAVRKEQSNILPTDEEPIASLLDPDCEIPPDIHFEIYDEAGTMLGLLGAQEPDGPQEPCFQDHFL